MLFEQLRPSVDIRRQSLLFRRYCLAEMAPWTLARLEHAVENFSAQLQCAICLCAYDIPVSLPCNHCFCEECIHRALELKPLCPICKTPAKKRRLRYDTTVQELLRATEMLTATPAAAAEADRVAEKQVKKEVKVAAGKVAAATLERRSSPRHVAAKRSSQTKSPSTQTSIDVWVSGGSAQGVKIKKEKVSTPVATSVRRSSPRRTLMQEMNSQVEASPMSPALFEVSAPRVAKSPQLRRTTGTTKDDDVDEQTLTLRRRRRSDTDAVGMEIVAAVGETQLEAVERKQQRRLSPLSRQSTTDALGVDTVVAETQLEVVGQEQQQTPTRRRRSTTDGARIRDGTQLESTQLQEQQEPARSTRRRSATDLVSTLVTADETQLEAEKTKHQTPTPRKRRRSATNGVASDAVAQREAKQQSVPNGKVAYTNGSAETSSLATDSQTQPLPDVELEVFQVGDLVDVIERQWIGINKLGGAARITKVHGDGFYAVKFVMGSKDSRVPGSFIRRPAEELVSDLTPSRSVKKRQRRRVSDIMISPDLLAAKTGSSTDSVKVKTKTKSKTKGNHSGMVFLCSGFKEDRMQQIDEWAELLEAEVVQYWSNDVTHLIVKCVNGDDAGEVDPSMEDSDSASSPQGHQAGKRKLFSDPKSGRWVKIRSLKYLKALVGGRWIVSDEWLEGKVSMLQMYCCICC